MPGESQKKTRTIYHNNYDVKSRRKIQSTNVVKVSFKFSNECGDVYVQRLKCRSGKTKRLERQDEKKFETF